MVLHNVLEINRLLLPSFAFDGMISLDATAGNGHDTLLLSRLAGRNGHVLAMDVQQSALDATKLLLEKESALGNVELILDSHAAAAQYLHGRALQLAVFNLGYLPGGNKTITTTAQSVITALENLLPLISPGGAVFLTAYPGHAPGKKEAQALEEYISVLPQTAFSVLKTAFVNQKNSPPQIFIISKR